MSEEYRRPRYLVIGSCIPVIQNTLFSPLKRVYNLVQVQGELVRQGRIGEPYKGYTDCAKQSYSTGGLVSFWRGNVLGTVVSIPQTIIRFASSRSFYQQSSGDLFKIKDICFGSAVGSVYLLVFYPLEYASFRLLSDAKQDKEDEYQFKGIMDVFRKTWNKDGIVGLYRGLGISILGIFAYRSLLLAFKSILKSMLKDKNAKVLLIVLPTILAGIITYPMETIRKRLMMTSGGDKKYIYQGAIDCFKQIVEKEGFASLYNGMVLRMFEGMVGGIFSMVLAHKLRSVIAS